MSRLLVLAIIASSLLSSCSLIPCLERRHDSGLLIVCADRVPELSSALRDTSAYAWELAEAHSDVFGYPWPDPATAQVELRVTGPDAEPFIASWMAGSATRGTGDKTLPLPAPTVPLRRVLTDRTVARLRALQDGLVPPKDLPDGDLIYEDGPEQRRNVIMIWIDHQSDALLRALAARYGTDAIVIRIEPNPHFGYQRAT